MAKDEVLSSQLPFIYKSSREIDSSGQLIKEREIKIQGKTLDECYKIYKKEVKYEKEQ